MDKGQKKEFRKFLKFLESYDKPRCTGLLECDGSVCLLGALNEYKGLSAGDERAYGDFGASPSEELFGLEPHEMFSVNDETSTKNVPDFPGLVPFLKKEFLNDEILD